MLQGKVRAHHLHTEQNTYRGRQGRERKEIRQQQHIFSTKVFHVKTTLKIYNFACMGGKSLAKKTF